MMAPWTEPDVEIHLTVEIQLELTYLFCTVPAKDKINGRQQFGSDQRRKGLVVAIGFFQHVSHEKTGPVWGAITQQPTDDADEPTVHAETLVQRQRELLRLHPSQHSDVTSKVDGFIDRLAAALEVELNHQRP